jgi:hypothetical protein
MTVESVPVWEPLCAGTVSVEYRVKQWTQNQDDSQFLRIGS